MSMFAAVYDFLNKPRYMYREYKTTLGLSQLEEDAAVRKSMRVVLFHEPLEPMPEIDDPSYVAVSERNSINLQKIAKLSAELRSQGYGVVRCQPTKAKKRKKMAEHMIIHGYGWFAEIEDGKATPIRPLISKEQS